MSSLHTESREVGGAYRTDYLKQVQNLIAQRRAASISKRHEFFAPDLSSVKAYESSLEPLRAEFRAMLGFPLVETPDISPNPTACETFVAHDDLGDIYRIEIEVFAGYVIYGLLFLPTGEEPHRLIISQHGGGGTPELTADFFGSANYNDMTRRILRRGYAVFAPQLLLWSKDHGPEIDRVLLDRQLKQLGGSIAALELFALQRALDYLLARPDILPDGAGMCGLSYGGFYTLFAAANDQRIRAAVSSCFVNDRFSYDWPDWVWQNAGNQFLDAEVAALVCPRSLYIEVGATDDLFDVEKARPILEEISATYARLGLEDKFASCIFDGGHEFSKTDEGLDFLDAQLSN